MRAAALLDTFKSRGVRIRTDSDRIRIGFGLQFMWSDRIGSDLIAAMSDRIGVSPGLNRTRLWRTD